MKQIPSDGCPAEPALRTEEAVCIRCVQDGSVPALSFDKNGVCNFCHIHDEMEKECPNDERGGRILQKLFRKAEKKASGKYNCIVGLSGGRDSSFLLWLSVKKWKLRPLAVHFNDGFDNPIAGENMLKACRKLKTDLETVTSHWDEARDLKIAFLKASVPDLNLGTDIGIGAALYGTALKHNIKTVLIGQSFRTEGIKPLGWSYFDGDYLRSVHRIFGAVPLKNFQAARPGFHLGLRELMFYSLRHRISVLTPLYYYPYNRAEAEAVLREDLDWRYPGAHYFDDLYHSLLKYVHRIKFSIDLNMNSDSALVRSGQMTREEGLRRKKEIYSVEDEDVIRLCKKRLNISNDQFEDFTAIPVKTFKDYPSSYHAVRKARPLIKALCQAHILPTAVYRKYFQLA